MANEIITLSGMLKFFKDDINTVTKGELKYKADFVLDLRIVDFSIMAKIRASMKDNSLGKEVLPSSQQKISHALHINKS